jgi:DNA-binding winged helix-turn-helix (wHTH) protein/TolB-like protein/Flp pilus assembly protein TadD
LLGWSKRERRWQKADFFLISDTVMALGGGCRMDRPISLDARRIDLSIEEPFRLGVVRIDPRAHEISWDGELRRLQPLTMKVLVALHDKSGEVVTRDELVDRCWDGRFVGEDVVNRCISLLRRVAADCGGFEIQTVPRTGYRFAETSRGAAIDIWRSTSAPGFALSASANRMLNSAGLLAGALLVVGGGFYTFERLNKPATDAVMLKPFDVAGSSPLARTFAAGVSADIDSAMSAAGVDILDADSSGQSKAQFILSGRTEAPGTDLHLTAELQDAADHAVLWSTSFTRPTGQMQPMQEQVASNLAAVLRCALETSREPGGDLDPGTIKLYLRACALQQAVDPPSDEIQQLLQQVTQRKPRFAAGWARLAFWAANAAFTASPQDAETMRRKARAAVRNALRLDPKSGVAYNAIAEMELGHVPFAVLHAQFQKVLSFAPDDDFTINDECELLLRMGSVEDALRMCRRGAELEPLSPQYAADLIRALIDDSRNSEAEAMLQRAVRIWPDDKGLKYLHLDYEARSGDPDQALVLLNQPDARPPVRDSTLEVFRRLITARKSGQPTEAKAFAQWLQKEVASNQLDADFGAPILAGMGDVNDAFKLAFSAPADNLQIDPEFLWEPESLPLRRDPRFIALAARFNVAAFWRTTGLWPDFCSTPNWPYNCKAEYARLARAKA